MLPLDTVNTDGTLKNATQLQLWFKQLASGGVAGVMTDVWWGVVEPQPQKYNWSPYLQIAQIASDSNLDLAVTLSFHKCGTNVGDACYIPLPGWVLSVGRVTPDIWYIDQQKSTDDEYLSLATDTLALFPNNNRTGLDLYRNFIDSFASAFTDFMRKGVLVDVQVGLGPAGELRYPSYQLQDNKWQYCGIGEFQCYNKYMLQSLQQAAQNVGHPEWGHAGPSNAGTYNSRPQDTGFFSDGGSDNYNSAYGQFFLNWYSQQLLSHADRVLALAATRFQSFGVAVTAKVSGIHWWYGTTSHAAEATGGYYNTNNNNAYLQIANLLAKYSVDFDFTCLEMTDSDSACASQPQELVKQAILATRQVGIHFCGENALPICSSSGCTQSAFDTIYEEATQYGVITRFTFLRLDSNLVISPSWESFTAFVKRMARPSPIE